VERDSHRHLLVFDLRLVPDDSVGGDGDSAVSVTDLPTIHVPIADIVIGERRREKLGGLKSLQRSIQAHGLIHPILLTERS
jgi:hypothetical protein